MINDEKEILMKKNVPVEQMLKYLGYENLTREMLEEFHSLKLYSMYNHYPFP